MDEQPKILKNMWMKCGTNILMTIISILLIIACEPQKDNIVLYNDKTFLKFPTYEEFCNINEFEVTNVVAFSVIVQNTSDSALVVLGNSFFIKDNVKSKFFIIHEKQKMELTFGFGEGIFPSKKNMDNMFELSLDLPNKWKPNCISEIEYNTLRDSIYRIAKNGLILYVPNEEDYMKYDSKYQYFKKPLIINRDSTKFIQKSYLPLATDNESLSYDIKIGNK